MNNNFINLPRNFWVLKLKIRLITGDVSRRRDSLLPFYLVSLSIYLVSPLYSIPLFNIAICNKTYLLPARFCCTP